MAKAFPVAHKRGISVFSVNPKDLTIDEAMNGRAFPYTQTEIFQRASTLKKHGQLQPIVVKREGEKVLVTAGVGRALGAQYLNEKDPDYAENPFLLDCVLQDDDADAFTLNVVENFERKTLTPVDIAHNIARSDERLGPEATEEAKMDAALDLFGLKDNGDNRKWVERHRKVGTLPMGIKRKVHAKTLAVDAALEYVGMDPETAEAVQAAAEEDAGGKKVTRKRVQTAAAKKGATSTRAERPVSHAINKAAFTAFLSYQVEHNKKTSVKTLCNGLLGYLSGEIPEPDFIKTLNKVTVNNA